MNRRSATLSILTLLVVPFASAGDDTIEGKVTAIDGKLVTLDASGDRPAWARKGAPVKFEGGVGRIASLTDTTLTLETRKADTFTVGAAVSLRKGPATLQGC